MIPETCRINADDHDHIHVLFDKVIDLLLLFLYFAVGILHIDLGTKLLCHGHKNIPVTLPAFDHKGIKAKTDLDLILRLLLFYFRSHLRGCTACKCQKEHQKQ